MFPQYLRRLHRALVRRGRSKRPRTSQATCPLQIESLEERTLLSIYFGDAPGLTVSDTGGQVLDHVHVKPVFWGSGWNTFQNQQLETTIVNAIDTILGGSYLNGLSQYRPGIGQGSRLSASNVTSPAPGLVFSDSDVRSLLQAKMADGTLPNPASDPNLLYFVFAPPGSVGAGSVSKHFDSGFGGTPYQYGWCQGFSTADPTTVAFSRELVGAVTDPHGSAVQINPRNATTWHDLGTGEAQSYTYRLGGVKVQSWWSQSKGVFVVPTGQVQNFEVSSLHLLTVKGDQLAIQFDDSITVDLTAAGGVKATLNNETATFDPGEISQVLVNSGAGNDTIQILHTAAAAPVTVGSTGSATVHVGSGTTAGIAGSVTIDGSLGPQHTELVVDDSQDNTSKIATLNTVPHGMIGFGRLTGLFSSAAAIEYNGWRTDLVTLQTGLDATVNVWATATPTNLIARGSSSVNIGANSQVFGTNLTITDPAGLVKLVVDDSNGTSAQAVTLDTVAIGGASYGRIFSVGGTWGAIRYKYAETQDVTLETGGTVGTFNILGTGEPINLIAHASANVYVGNGGSMAGINGPLVLNDPPGGDYLTLHVDDSNDRLARTVTLSHVTISGTTYDRLAFQNLAPIDYRPADTNSVTVRTGAAGATVNVLATDKPTNLIGNADGIVNVGNLGLLDDIKGLLNVTEAVGGGHVTLNVSDTADPLLESAILDTVLGQGAFYGRVSYGPQEAPIVYRATDTAVLNLSTGGSTIVYVEAVSVPTHIVGHGISTVNVGYAGAVDQIMAPLTITDPSAGGYTTLNVDDSLDGYFRTPTLDTTMIGGAAYGRISGLGDPDIVYKYAETNQVTLQTGKGGATVNVLATGTPTTIIGNATGIVNVGNAGHVDMSNSSLTISDPPSGAYVTINVDDSAGGNVRYPTLDTTAINGFDYGRISEPSWGTIQYRKADTAGATLKLGNLGADVHVVKTVVPFNLVGNPNGDVNLYGPDGDNTWSLTGLDAGTLTSSVSTATLTFTGAQYLWGGAVTNTFVFADGAGVEGTITGDGNDTLDYSAYSSSVLVDLQTGFATGVGFGVSGIRNVTGGNGGGVGVYNILVGYGGNTLTGGDGRRNLLIAGVTPSTLIGGNDDDILIAGTTNYDTEADLASLKAIMDFWSSSAYDYATRVSYLLGGVGVPRLDASTVTGNGDGNTLTGNHGGPTELDLFFGSDPNSQTTDYNPAIGEQWIKC